MTEKNEPILPLERRALQILCQGAPEGSLRRTAKEVLENYAWRDPIHKVIFDSLIALPSERPELIRAELPARLTRKGFPDIDWERFFQPHGLSKSEARSLFKNLRESK